ncbi:hypothetical protein J6590_082410 [Homalodisca vitripennis]|nr:hypothetical protein J6590_082410 [Homalodisca vitripennis]
MGDPHCHHHMHRFYRQMKCQPEMSPHYKCPTSYKCPTLEGRSPEFCYFSGRRYPVGFKLTRKHVDFETPCIQRCQCVRMYEGARFYCSTEDEKCKVPEGCHHYNFLEDFSCCERGVISCNEGQEGSVKCVYGGHTYSEGEKFFPSDDITCTQCICASGFNGSLNTPYCHQVSCALKLWGDAPVMLTRGCIPVYVNEKSCCPVTFRCPKPTDRVIKREEKSSQEKFKNTDKQCRFGNLMMDVGDHLTLWPEANAREVVCLCEVPPLPSCVRRNFFLTEEIRRHLAREGLVNQS